MCLRPVSAVNVHRHCVKLLQTRHSLEQQDDQSTAFNGLDCSCEEIGREGFEVLEDTHSVCVAENLFGLFVVAVADVGEGDEEFERIFGIRLPDSSLDLLLDLCLALLAMTL